MTGNDSSAWHLRPYNAPFFSDHSLRGPLFLLGCRRLTACHRTPTTHLHTGTAHPTPLSLSPTCGSASVRRRNRSYFFRTYFKQFGVNMESRPPKTRRARRCTKVMSKERLLGVADRRACHKWQLPILALLTAFALLMTLPMKPLMLRDLARRDLEAARHEPVDADDVAVTRLTALRVAMVHAVYAAPSMLVAGSAGTFSDRFGRKRFILLNLACQLLQYAGTGAAVGLDLGWEWIMVCDAISGMGGGFFVFLACVFAYIADETPPDMRGREFAFLEGAITGIGAAAPVIGGILVQSVGYSWLYGVASAAVLLTALLIACAPSSGQPQLQPLSRREWMRSFTPVVLVRSLQRDAPRGSAAAYPAFVFSASTTFSVSHENPHDLPQATGRSSLRFTFTPSDCAWVGRADVRPLHAVRRTVHGLGLGGHRHVDDGPSADQRARHLPPRPGARLVAAPPTDPCRGAARRDVGPDRLLCAAELAARALPRYIQLHRAAALQLCIRVHPALPSDLLLALLVGESGRTTCARRRARIRAAAFGNSMPHTGFPRTRTLKHRTPPCFSLRLGAFAPRFRAAAHHGVNAQSTGAGGCHGLNWWLSRSTPYLHPAVFGRSSAFPASRQRKRTSRPFKLRLVLKLPDLLSVGLT